MIWELRGGTDTDSLQSHAYQNRQDPTSSSPKEGFVLLLVIPHKAYYHLTTLLFAF